MSAFPGFARGMTVLIVLAGSADAKDLHFAVVVSGNAEWRVVKPLFARETIKTSPYVEYFYTNVDRERVLFF